MAKTMKKTMGNSLNGDQIYAHIEKRDSKSAWNNSNYFQRCEKLSRAIIQGKTRKKDIHVNICTPERMQRKRNGYAMHAANIMEFIQ